MVVFSTALNKMSCMCVCVCVRVCNLMVPSSLQTNETVFRFLLNETQDFYRPLIESNRFYSFMVKIVITM